MNLHVYKLVICFVCFFKRSFILYGKLYNTRSFLLSLFWVLPLRFYLSFRTLQFCNENKYGGLLYLNYPLFY